MTAVVLFTRDLRVHDNPALAAACSSAEHVVPLFVVDPAVPGSPNRERFLAESLADLREALRARGGDLVIRYGDPVTEAIRVAGAADADTVHVAADVSRYATRRARRLAEACASHRLGYREFPGVTVVPPGDLRPTGGGDHYRIFTPYWRAWQVAPRRSILPPPRRVPLPPGWTPDPAGAVLQPDAAGSPRVATGGERAGREALARWSRRVHGYADQHDDLPGDRTSRLSPYLHFGCVSPGEVAARAARAASGRATGEANGRMAGEAVGGRMAREATGAEQFVRQLCWRDFYQQLLAGFPELPRRAYRRADEAWRDDRDALAAWRDGQTGVPIVDAGMRQLAREGWMHNRARLITAGFLTRMLRLDWRDGARVFAELLLDADVANNNGNWQWVAGTGTDPRPNRGFNPIRQALRFDPHGDYVRRYLPELESIDGPAVHQPWRHAGHDLRYPPPIDAPTFAFRSIGTVSVYRGPVS